MKILSLLHKISLILKYEAYGGTIKYQAIRLNNKCKDQEKKAANITSHIYDQVKWWWCCQQELLII